MQATSGRGEIPRRPERAQIHQEAEECAAEESAAETALHQVPPQLPPAQAGQSRVQFYGYGLGVLLSRMRQLKLFEMNTSRGHYLVK